MDPRTLPVSNMELFMTTVNDFQHETIVIKISEECLNLHIIVKDRF